MRQSPCSHLPLLSSGATIGISAPSGAFDPVRLGKGVDVLRGLGFQVYLPPGLDRQKRYLAGDDTHRAELLAAVAARKEVDAVMCARGGFGSLRMLPLLDLDALAAHGKPLIGFSDITTLLVPLSLKGGVPVIHGPVVTSLAGAPRVTQQALFQVLTLSRFPCMGAPEGVTLTPGRASGVLTGGNLATLCHLAGTSFQPRLNGTILLLEEINEAPYRIDRMLTQMHLAGMFQGVRGVVLGTFTNCGRDATVHEIVQEHFPGQPLFSGLAVGHDPVNLALPMGVPVVLDAEARTLCWTVS